MPAVQSTHRVLPLSSWNLPAAHLSHVLCPLLLWKVPALQGVWAVEPVEQNEPAGHTEQLESSGSCGELPNRPPGHGSSAEAPVGQ